MEVYKVLRRDRTGLASVTQHHPHVFKEGKVTSSPNAPIFVFEQRGAAVNWAQTRVGTEVELWLVEVDYLWDMPRIIHTFEKELEDPAAVEAWWKGEIELKTMPTPYSTKIAPAVRLIKKLPMTFQERETDERVR